MLADIVILLVILFCIFLGYKRGLIKVAVRIFSFIAAIIIALILYTPISNHIIENTEIVPNLEKTIGSKIYDKNETEDSSTNNLIDNMQKYVENYTEGIKENTSNMIAHELAIMVVRIGTWIGLFIITKLLLIFIRIFTNVIAEIPIIKQFNKVGGTIYGILEGFVIVYVALAVLNAVSPMLGKNTLYEQIDDSHICKAMYENNIILKVIL